MNQDTFNSRTPRAGAAPACPARSQPHHGGGVQESGGRKVAHQPVELLGLFQVQPVVGGLEKHLQAGRGRHS